MNEFRECKQQLVMALLKPKCHFVVVVTHFNQSWNFYFIHDMLIIRYLEDTVKSSTKFLLASYVLIITA